MVGAFRVVLLQVALVIEKDIASSAMPMVVVDVLIERESVRKIRPASAADVVPVAAPLVLGQRRRRAEISTTPAAVVVIVAPRQVAVTVICVSKRPLASVAPR